MTKAEFRKYLVLYHGLNGFKYHGTEGILSYIDQVGSIQFDPLDQVGNNPHLVLQGRVKHYKPKWLNQLLYEDRVLMDGWDKCLSIYKTEDWQRFKRYHEGTRRHDRFFGESHAKANELTQQVMEEVKQHGPVCSLDLAIEGQMDWYWAPTSVGRAALEYLYYSGDLIIHHKQGTRKYYDLMARYFDTAFIDGSDCFKTEQDFYTWLLLRRIQAVGGLWNKASDAFLGMRGFKAKHRNAGFKALLESGDIVQIDVAGEAIFVPTSSDDLMCQLETTKIKPWVHFFAPLDNMLWDRKLIDWLFDFDYKWEVYTPMNQRKYGYYVLPILYRDKLIGRFEPSFDKKDHRLTIKNWWWEADFKPNQAFEKALQQGLKRFCQYLGAHHMEDLTGYIS